MLANLRGPAPLACPGFAFPGEPVQRGKGSPDLCLYPLHPLPRDGQVPRSTGQGLFPTILLHFLHPWRSDVRERRSPSSGVSDAICGLASPWSQAERAAAVVCRLSFLPSRTMRILAVVPSPRLRNRHLQRMLFGIEMLELNQEYEHIKNMQERVDALRGYL